MATSYDVFAAAFLGKITEYKFVKLACCDTVDIIDGYCKTACAQFNRVCNFDLVTEATDEERSIEADIDAESLYEIVDIVATGMVVQWLQPYMFQSENLQNVLNTRDYSSYSPAELLLRVREVYEMARRDFKNMMKDYSYDHGDLSDLSL